MDEDKKSGKLYKYWGNNLAIIQENTSKES